METIFLFFLIFIGVQLIYNIALVSGVQQSESVTHITVTHISYTHQLHTPPIF